MKEKKQSKKTEYKVIFCFADGREIPSEEFDAERDLTDEQNQKIQTAFEEVFSKS